MSIVANKFPHVRAALCNEHVLRHHEQAPQQRQYSGHGRAGHWGCSGKGDRYRVAENAF